MLFNTFGPAQDFGTYSIYAQNTHADVSSGDRTNKMKKVNKQCLLDTPAQ